MNELQSLSGLDNINASQHRTFVSVQQACAPSHRAVEMRKDPLCDT